MYDFLIIGQGIAGSMFACTALQQGFSVCIIDNNNQYAASNVASGVVNPITGRRMVKTWMADELIPFAINTYKNIEKQLDISFIQEISIAKIISSEADAAIWNGRLNNEDYKNNLSPIQSLNNPNINEAVGVGFIRPTFWMDIKAMIKKFRDFFLSQNILMEEKFDYNLLSINNDISYQSKKSAIPPLGGRGAVRAKYIIFCEGFQVQHNPFFNFIPFQPAKGEQLKIYSEALKLNVIINKNIFIIPVGNNEYQVGSTYIWHDETEQVTDFGKNEILGKLNKIILCDYKIIDEKAGIRPTIIDRRPVLGAHQIHKNMFIFNGLGTKGISLAPYFSKELLLHITENKPLDKEVDIARFCNQ